MSHSTLQKRRDKRREFFERISCIGLTKFGEKPKNGDKGTCQRCNKQKKIVASGLCDSCYKKENATGTCKKCKGRGVLRGELCDPCYRAEKYTGKCLHCKRLKVLKAGLCSTCYKKKAYHGICRTCGEEDTLTGGLCSKCWEFDNRKGSCSKCGHVGTLTANLCSTCYKNENATGECKLCGNTGVLTDSMCKTCYDKEHYYGMCNSCGNSGVLIRDWCRSCYDKQEQMGNCVKCGNNAVLDHNKECKKCTGGDLAVCKVCAKERTIVFDNMCKECYTEKAEGISHYMRSSIKKVIQRLVGKKNYRKEAEEIFMPGEKNPFQADFEIRDLTGKWCPVQYFNSKQDWTEKYGTVMDFKMFYNEYLKPRNYIMFTSKSTGPDSIKQYLMDRGFLQPNGLPYGKKITKKPKDISKRKVTF